jgi:hypothetical protein
MKGLALSAFGFFWDTGFFSPLILVLADWIAFLSLRAVVRELHREPPSHEPAQAKVSGDRSRAEFQTL